LPVRSRGPAVCSLWHFPAGRPDWPLASTLPCGGRTFLDPGEPGPRPPSRLPLPGQYATGADATRSYRLLEGLSAVERVCEYLAMRLADPAARVDGEDD
jgi:hypothetical protein